MVRSARRWPQRRALLEPGGGCWYRAGLAVPPRPHHFHSTVTASQRLCAEFVLFVKGYWCGQAEVNHAKVHSPKPAAVPEGQWQELLDPQPRATGAVVNIDNINCQNV